MSALVVVVVRTAIFCFFLVWARPIFGFGLTVTGLLLVGLVSFQLVLWLASWACHSYESSEVDFDPHLTSLYSFFFFYNILKVSLLLLGKKK